MAVTAKWYGQAALGQFSGTFERRVDWVNDTIKVALLDAEYTPDQDAHDFFDDVSEHELVAPGYTAGGRSLAERTVSYDAASKTVTLSAADVQWGGLSATTAYAVIYKEVEQAPGESPLLGYVDFGEALTTASGVLKVEWADHAVLTALVAVE